MSLTISLAQLEWIFGDPDGNYLFADRSVRDAAENGSDLVLFPELWASGFDLGNAGKYASPIDQGWFEKMRSLAIHYKIAVGGTLLEDSGGKYFNTFALYDHTGTCLGSYRKIHLFRMLEEDRYLKQGEKIEVVETPWGKLGLAICYDLRFPEVIREYCLQGAELILLSAEWPAKRIGHWEILLKARAIENQVFIAAVNKVGSSQGAPLGGTSMVLDPMGEVLVQGGDQAALLTAEIDLEKVQKTRHWMPVFDDRKPEAY